MTSQHAQHLRSLYASFGQECAGGGLRAQHVYSFIRTLEHICEHTPVLILTRRDRLVNHQAFFLYSGRVYLPDEPFITLYDQTSRMSSLLRHTFPYGSQSTGRFGGHALIIHSPTIKPA